MRLILEDSERVDYGGVPVAWYEIVCLEDDGIVVFQRLAPNLPDKIRKEIEPTVEYPMTDPGLITWASLITSGLKVWVGWENGPTDID